MANLNSATNCSQFYDSTTYKILAGLRAGVGLFSALCCLAVIAIVILLKKYKLFSQRLILNIAVAAFVHSLSYTTARVNYYTVRKIQDPYCNFGGLFNDYAATVELISICFVAINIFSVGFCRKNISRVEILCYVVTYGLPSLWLWVPVWLGAYGTSDAVCAIRSLNETCHLYRKGTYIQFGIWYIPLYTSSAIIIAMLIAVLVKIYCTTSCRRKHRNPLAKATKVLLYREIRPLVVYPIIYLLLNTFALISQVYDALCTHCEYHLQPVSTAFDFLHAVSSPLRGAFIAMAFACSRDTWRRVRAREWMQRWQGKEVTPVEPMESTTDYDIESERRRSVEKCTERDPLLSSKIQNQ